MAQDGNSSHAAHPKKTKPPYHAAPRPLVVVSPQQMDSEAGGLRPQNTKPLRSVPPRPPVVQLAADVLAESQSPGSVYNDKSQSQFLSPKEIENALAQQAQRDSASIQSRAKQEGLVSGLSMVLGGVMGANAQINSEQLRAVASLLPLTPKTTSKPHPKPKGLSGALKKVTSSISGAAKSVRGKVRKVFNRKSSARIGK